MKKLDILVRRLKKININLEFVENFPWVYLIKVNGNFVVDKNHSEHSFCIGLYNQNENDISFYELKNIFNIIRKYSEKR